MRTFFSESKPNYGSYHFPYAQFAELEPGDDLSTLYGEGYLPASAHLTEHRLLFYRARSLRFDLSELQFDKKRRYLHRRGNEAGFRWEALPLERFLAEAPSDWKDTLLAWVEARHTPPFLDRPRLDYILSRPYLQHVAVVRRHERWAGLVPLPQGTDCAHYWFAFFDPDAAPENYSLGRWILAETALRLAAQRLRHLYLGTAYGLKSAYKFQGVREGAAFFDGNQWSPDLDELQRRLAADPA